MALDLVTGYKGAAHITAEDIGAFNAGVFGSGEYVLNSGNKLAASVISNNTIRILDGDLVVQGRHVTLKKDTYEEVTIENGETGMNRKDLIVARYTKDSTNGIENVVFAVIKGEFSDSEASDPAHTTGDILSGGCTLHEMPLYRITLTGLNVGEPEALFAVEENGLLDMSGLVFRGELTHRFSTPEESSAKYWRNIGSGVFQVPYGSYIGGYFNNKSNKGTLLNIVSANAVTQLFCTADTVALRTTKNDEPENWHADWNYIETLRTKSVRGKYTGTGDAGTSFKNSLTLSMNVIPKIVIIRCGYNTLIFTNQMDWAGWVSSEGTTYSVSTTISQVEAGSKYAVQWWSNNNSADEQMNASGVVYYYAAFA